MNLFDKPAAQGKLPKPSAVHDTKKQPAATADPAPNSPLSSTSGPSRRNPTSKLNGVHETRQFPILANQHVKRAGATTPTPINDVNKLSAHPLPS